ncbi:MAG: MOSC domain-containing protein [Acidobacteriota bacterium]|nr:MOSC domain-containing protein [Acidobacteriota bacterium]
MPRLESVNVAVPRTLHSRGRDVPTGIFKEPAGGRLAVGPLGLSGDIQADKRYHGGVQQALYAYSSEHAAFWGETVPRPGGYPPGFFGENLTTTGMIEKDVAVGDVYRIGTALVQVTKPRAPCFKMGLRAGSAGFVRTFLASGRIGFYLSVPEPGEIGAGDSIERLERPVSALFISELIRLLYFRPDDTKGLTRALEAGALPPVVRLQLEESLERARERAN